MTFETLTELCGGKLINNSSLREYKEIKFNAKDVTLGDLFVYSDFEDLELAIKNGAYGILVDKDVKIIDDEISWILVDSLHTALIKIVRFLLLERDVIFIYFQDIEFQLAKSITNKTLVTSLDENGLDNFKKIMDIKRKIFISNDKKFLKKIYPDYLHTKSIENNIKIIEHSTFLTSFIYKNHYYKETKISKIFIDDLNLVLELLDEKKIPYKIDNCNFIDNFKPFFVDKRLTQKSFGTTESVLIFENNINMIEKEYNYLKSRPTWSDIIIVLPNSYKSRYSDENFIFFKTPKEFLKLKNIDFNFALILASNEEFFEIINTDCKKKELTLF